jgi:hypothetical protein
LIGFKEITGSFFEEQEIIITVEKISPSFLYICINYKIFHIIARIWQTLQM